MNSTNFSKDITSKNAKLPEKPWIEKYRPQALNDVVSHIHIIKALKKFVKTKNLPHMILFGPPGTGKTSSIVACAKELYGDSMCVMCIEINASEERGVDIVRNRIVQFVSGQNMYVSQKENLLKLVILDEADSMTDDAQIMLRTVIEKYSNVARFCLICNYLRKIHSSILSRCKQFRFAPLSVEHIKERLIYVCQEEKIKITEDGTNEIIRKSNGDMRKVLNILQTVNISEHTINKDIVNTCLCSIKSEDVDKIIHTLIKDDVNASYNLISRYIREEGYSLTEILYDISRKIFDTIKDIQNVNDDLKKLDINILSRLIEQLGKIEFGSLLNVSINVLILTFIGNFKLVISD